jgi:hypothetical protein
VIPVVYLGAAIAALIATNALTGHLWLSARDELAAVGERNAQVGAVARACSDGVAEARAESERRTKAVLDALAGQRKEITRLNNGVTSALTAKPSNPDDLCDSAAVFLREQIKAERGIPQP